MKRGETLLALLLSLVGAVLDFVPPGRPAVYGFSAPQHELPACGTYCGTEWWSVKTLSDADRDKVDFTAKEATVGWLVSQEHPAQSPADQRIGPIETQTYKVRARLRSEEHTSELQSLAYLVCRLLLEKKNIIDTYAYTQHTIVHSTDLNHRLGAM